MLVLNTLHDTIKPDPAGSKPTPASEALWIKIPFANIICYVPSRIYFARIRVKGKLVCMSLKTDVLSGVSSRWPIWKRPSARLPSGP
jgi:hypothetical protein